MVNTLNIHLFDILNAFQMPGVLQRFIQLFISLFCALKIEKHPHCG